MQPPRRTPPLSFPVRRKALVGAAAALFLLTGCAATSKAQEKSPTAALDAVKSYVRVPGAPLGPASGELRLTSGRRWTFDQARRGAITLVYFGYTSCPDVCPLTMADLARALKELPSSTRSRIDVRFVSTDPHRDTRTQLTAWLGGFDPGFVGARGPIGTVISAARTYGISIAAPRVVKGDYQVAHGAQLLVLRPGGGMVGYFRQLSGWRRYDQALPTLVRAYSGGTTSDPTAAGKASSGPLRLDQGWVNASPLMSGMSGMSHEGGGGTAAAYARLSNTSHTASQLVSATSPQASSVQLSQTTSSAAGSVMTRAREITVPPRGSADLRPDGYHLMVSGLRHRLGIGDRLHLTLGFRDGTVMKVVLPVIDPTDRPGAGA